jgi:antitoxin CptB
MTAWNEARRKRLLYRCTYTGTKETDILLGQFVRTTMATMSQPQLDRFEALIDSADPDLFLWICGRKRVPEQWKNDIMTLLQKFRIKL